MHEHTTLQSSKAAGVPQNLQCSTVPGRVGSCGLCREAAIVLGWLSRSEKLG